MTMSQEHSDTGATQHRWDHLTEAERRAFRAVITHAHRLPNPNEISDDRLTAGQRVADGVARTMGSWRFIIIQTVVLVAWITLNIIGWREQWDPYPFILLNLALSFQAAYSAPIIMMSQNRQAAKDRLTAEHDYQVNLHADAEVAQIRNQLSDLSGRQWRELVQLQHQQLELLERIDRLTTEVHSLTARYPGTHGEEDDRSVR